jgi:2-dehydro-3-deoxyphosphogluconate aldolase / (4S)-4-hydroxy-2-oxoglutarate aldolase
VSAEVTLRRLAEARVIAVIRVDRRGASADAARALRAGGLQAIELTWTSPEPAAELAAVREEHGAELLLGAGTLRSPAEVADAVAAGADFLVSPHFEPELCGAMIASGKLALPGAFTPSEIAAALAAGASAVKLFPASLGGVAHLRAVLAPFPGLRVVPTGGVDSANAAEWLAAGALAVGAGSELCPPAAIAAGNWAELTAAAERFRAAVGGGEGAAR